MKMTREALKELVKECLVEVLRDGLGAQAPGEKPTRAPATETRQQQATVKQQPQPARQPNNVMMETIRREAGSSSVMTDILTDTAMTTLPGFIASERGQVVHGGGPAELAVASSTPEELFGEENTARWASLAFDGGKKTT